MAQHLVHRVRFELRLADSTAASAAQQAASRFAHHQLPALLEALLDTRFPHDPPLRLDRLVLDLGSLPATPLDAALATAFTQAFNRTQLPSAPSAPTRDAPPRPAETTPPLPRPGPPTHEAIEAFLHYLVTGTLPWWCSTERWHQFLTEVLPMPDALASLQTRVPPLLQAAPARGLRLLPFPQLLDALFAIAEPTLASAPTFHAFLHACPPTHQPRWKLSLWLTSLTDLQNTRATTATQDALTQLLPETVLHSLPLSTLPLKPAVQPFDAAEAAFDRHWSTLAHLLGNRLRPLHDHALSPPEALRPVPPPAADAPTLEAGQEPPPTPASPPERSASPTPSAQPVSTPPGPKPPLTPAERTERTALANLAEEGLPTPSAGLALLHPFLPRFFQHVGWLDPKKRWLPDRRWPAAQLLHHLAQGRVASDETELVLERFLVGLPLTEAGTLPDLAPESIAEAEELLRAVIAHWTALKNTSVEGLREAFLARPGLLYLHPKPLLRVEPRAYDMLLGRLPWSIDPMLLPWLPAPLKVDWPRPQ